MATQNRNGVTRYEAIAENAETGARYLIGYTPRKNRAGLLAILRQFGADVVIVTGAENINAGARAADGFSAGAWRFHFSGRTSLEARTVGELPWIVDHAQALRGKVGAE